MRKPWFKEKESINLTIDLPKIFSSAILFLWVTIFIDLSHHPKLFLIIQVILVSFISFILVLKLLCLLLLKR